MEQTLEVDDIWMSLAKQYSDTFFQMKTDEYFQMIAGTQIILECWAVHIYGVLVKRNLMDKIEDLPEETKNILWNDAKDYLPNNSVDRTKKVCRAIHAISTYIQL